MTTSGIPDATRQEDSRFISQETRRAHWKQNGWWQQYPASQAHPAWLASNRFVSSALSPAPLLHQFSSPNNMFINNLYPVYNNAMHRLTGGKNTKSRHYNCILSTVQWRATIQLYVYSTWTVMFSTSSARRYVPCRLSLVAILPTERALCYRSPLKYDRPFALPS